MIPYIARRLLFVTCGLLIVSFVIFVGIRVAPGDPADVMILGVPTAEEKAAIHKRLGLDKPILTQYGVFLRDLFLHGDLGESYFSPDRISSLLLKRIPVSLQLVSISFFFTLLIGIPAGFASAVFRNTPFDYAVVSTVYVLQALPNFWVALLLIMFFAVRMSVLPAFGRGGIETFVLPSISLALPIVGRVTRFVRSGLLRVMPELYIRTAYSKGLAPGTIYFKHAFRNALIPLVTDLSMQFVWTIGNAIVIEVIFGWAGVGRLTMTAIGARDYPTVQGCVLFFAAMFMLVNLVVDLAYVLIDPRIEYK